MIGAIIIVALVAIGGLYYWGMRLNQQMLSDEQNTAVPDEKTQTPPTSTSNGASEDPAVKALQTQSSSDETSSIEADLNATNVESLDGDMQGVNTTSGN